MNYIVIGLRFFVFFISCLGYWELLRRKTKMNIYFLPSMTIAIQTTLLFIGGLLNMLQETTFLLYSVGILFFVLFICKDKSLGFLKQYLKVGYLFLIITIVLILICVRGKIFSHYDNFSHWALVVRQMLDTNRYPNFKDTIISFKDYPLGTSTFIYYFSKLVGRNESFQMFAQAYIILTAIIPVFIYCKKNQYITCVWMVIATNFILMFNVRITDLLVDTVLPVFSMCALLYVYNYGRNLKLYQTEAYFSIFYTILILQIKNSGVFFAVIISAWMIIGNKKDRNIRERLVIAITPYASLFLWKIHCANAFSNADKSKHAMTVSNYSNVFKSKTSGEMRQITKDMLRFTMTWKDTMLIFLCLIFIGILALMITKKHIKTFVKVFGLCIVMYLVYQVGMIFMYMFSMPGKEATNLAGHERYCRTILLAIFYVSLLLFMKVSSDMKKSVAGISCVILTGLLILINNGEINTIYSYHPVNDERLWMESKLNEYNIPIHESYCILIPKEDGEYTYALCKYLFQTDNIKVLISASKKDLDEIYTKYIINYDQDNSNVSNWISMHYPKQEKDEVITMER